ncbi:MAG TPA: Gfo/Idh/MocA family oxidoreductase [Chitinophagales bacterium]
MAKKVKIGLLGAGHLGKIHLKLLQEIDGYEVVGFYDTDETVAKNVSEQFGVKAFDHAENLVLASDAIDIVAPTSFHYPLGAFAAKKGKHIFIEKPLTATVSEARKLVEIIDEARIKAMVGHVERFNPAVLSLKGKNIDPLFIEVHRLAQFNPRGTDVSVVLDLMIHDLDIILSLVKGNVKRVHASGVGIISNSPDIANARIEFDNGCVANLTASRISMKNMRKMRIFQNGAYISLDFMKKKSEVITIHDLPEADQNYVEFEIPGKSKKYIQFSQTEGEEVNAIKMELSLFLSAIQNNTPVPVSVHEGLRAMELAHTIIEKIRKQLLAKEL